jgi:cytoskeletal protein CcmA (bactofilin family)
MDQTNVAAFIGHGVEFKGIIKYQGNVRIDGQLDGEVHANGTLYLGEQAVLRAKISAQAVISKGQITGDITAREKVQLLAPAIIDGSILTPSLLMEEGVTFNGTLEMNTVPPALPELEDSYTSTTANEALTSP